MVLFLFLFLFYTYTYFLLYIRVHTLLCMYISFQLNVRDCLPGTVSLRKFGSAVGCCFLLELWREEMLIVYCPCICLFTLVQKNAEMLTQVIKWKNLI